MDALPAARREKLASLFQRFARHLAFLLLPTAVIALVDLATGFLLDDRRLDIGLLAAAAFGLTEVVWLRRVARGFRSGELPRAAPVRWGRNVIGIVALLGVSAGIGYLFGGMIVGIAIPLVTILFGGVLWRLGLPDETTAPGGSRLKNAPGRERGTASGRTRVVKFGQEA